MGRTKNAFSTSVKEIAADNFAGVIVGKPMNDVQLDNEAKQLVDLATFEAEKIDSIIKKTVYAAQD